MWKNGFKYIIQYRSFATVNPSLPSSKSLWNHITKKTYLAQKEASNFCLNYQYLSKREKQEMLEYIAVNFGANKENVKIAANSFLVLQNQGPDCTVKAMDHLKLSLTPKYEAAFTSISSLGYGVKFLVDLRADVQDLISERNVEDDVYYHLKALSAQLKNMLASSFAVSSLSLERITWDSSCHMLQKISEYESVHPVRNWADLKQRVGPYRRCYVFTHASMPKEPIVMLHVALTQDISSTISSIVTRCANEPYFSNSYLSHYDEEDQSKIEAAVFYSITSSQKGLHGIELGSKLIKKVVAEVLKEYPHISKFSSLSPIPGFKDWALLEIRKANDGDSFLSGFFTEESFVSAVHKDFHPEKVSFWKHLGQLLASNRWTSDPAMISYFKMRLMKLCAHYLYKEKRRSYALNSVAHFHLRNGAVMWRLNWAADMSPRGLDNSCGIMVNYRYYIENTESNSEKYQQEYEIKVSESVKELLNI